MEHKDKNYAIKRKTKYIWICELLSIILITIDVCVGIFVKEKIWVILLSIFSVWLILTLVAFYLVNSKIRSSQSKISWLLAFICFPIFAHILFFILASNPFKFRGKKAYVDMMKKYLEWLDVEDTNEYLKNGERNTFYRLFHISHRLLNSNAQNNYAFELIENNTNMYNETLKMISKAKKFIFLNYYIIKSGFWLDAIIQMLIKKANEGVKIFILYDWFGCVGNIKRSDLKKLSEHPNITVAMFKAKTEIPFRFTNNFRSHAKLLLIDNVECIYGGSNIANEYINMSKKNHNWGDLNYIVRGKIVDDLSISFVCDWECYSKIIYKKDPIYDLMNYLKELGLWEHAPATKMENKGICFYNRTWPNYYPTLLDNELNLILTNAKHEIKIITPYFLPSSALKNAFETILNAGIKVKMILPGKPDNKKFMLYSNRSHYDELIRLGCEIYEYDGFIHAKMLLIDNDIVSIGTNNLDLRSLLINFESCLWIYDNVLSKNLSNVFEDIAKVSKKIDLYNLKQLYGPKERYLVFFSQLIKALL